MFLENLIKHWKSAFKMCISLSPFGFSSAVSFARKESELFKKLVNDPCEENAVEYIEHRKNKPAFSFTYSNHPSVWASLREKWYVINASDRISYEMKKAIMEDLMWQGLHLNNQKIINNYKGDSLKQIDK